jgi:hypothetical protein
MAPSRNRDAVHGDFDMTDSLNPASLVNFALTDLAPFTLEKALPDCDIHHLLLLVGRDDVHEAMKHILRRTTRSLHLNMFGYDDEELNAIIMGIVHNPDVLVQITLDKSQAGGVHERKILDADRAASLSDFNTHFVVGQSATHSISHTKGFVADGLVGCHGSTNWSTDGEGVFVTPGQSGGVGFKAQNNTQSFFTDGRSVKVFQDRLTSEHLVALNQRPATITPPVPT